MFSDEINEIFVNLSICIFIGSFTMHEKDADNEALLEPSQTYMMEIFRENC